MDSIQFERSPGMTARLVGQPNLDFTMPGRSYKPEEIKKEEPKKPDEKKPETESKKADKKEEPKKDGKAEAKKDEAKKDEAKKEESKKDEKAEPKKEESKKDEKAEPKKADEKKAEPKKEESKKDEKAEPKKADEKKPEAKKEEPKKEVAKKAEEKKAEEEDDVNAPLPGTTAPTKIPRLNPKANGIRDLHLALHNLRPSPIKQVTVNLQTDKGATSYRLDTTDSEDWPIAVRRSGTESSADLFLEPPPGDVFQKDFTVNVTYEDNQNANATAKVPFHTKSDQAVDATGPSASPLGVRVHLSGDDVLTGSFEAITEDALKLTTPWQDRLSIPLARVIGVHLAPMERKESPESFARRLKTRGSEDVLLARTKNGEVVAIPGVLEGADSDRLRFVYQGKSRTLPIAQVEGVILATRAEPEAADAVQGRFRLADGVAISGRWKDLDTVTWKVATPWGQELKLPAGEVTEVRFRGGRMTYLSDLTPSKVEEVPYFGRKLPWRRDVNLLGEPLKMDGRTYARGIAVHSRSVLTYELGGKYATFEATVGFDDAAQGAGG